MRGLARRLKLQQLRLIAAIGEKGSLLQAASVLGVTQPALTRALHELEALFGAPLFERHSRGVTPTPLGQRLLITAQRVLGELKECEYHLGALLQNPQRLPIGALSSAATSLLPGAIHRLQAEQPALQLQVEQGSTEQLLALLRDGEIDLIVGRLYPSMEAFDCQLLYQDQIVVLASAAHPLFELTDPAARLARLASFPLALPAKIPVAAEEVEQMLQRLSLRQPSVLESSSLALIRELLLLGDALTIAPRLMFGGDLMRGQLREIAVVPGGAERPCGIIRRRQSRPGPLALRLIAALRAQIAQLESLSS